MFQANKKSPKEWLGPNNIPGSPEQQERLKWAKDLYKTITGEKI